MKTFVGIDLGTTNSTICSYNGIETRIWKSPEQNDVTPSALYIDNRGNRYVGKRAYDSAPHSPENSAILFKRLMGTNTPIKLPAVKLTMSPEECSTEVLKVLFGYLPEEIRNNPDTGTVVTVPAAFNQMQKDATLQAIDGAGIGKIALMQEPVAAVMSVAQTVHSDGIFLIFDLGGGTLDIAIAENISGHINLLSHGGIARCGGRDFDRTVIDNIVRHWLRDNFSLPTDFSVNPEFKTLMRLATWASERAKIELSAREETVISLSEMETRVKDLKGKEIYLEIPFQRETFNRLIAKRLGESIDAARSSLSEAGLNPEDVQQIIFIGGPTNYKPLRDKVVFELGISGSTDVNPMTAVAEGASLFAESINWSSQDRSRKNSEGQLSSKGPLSLKFNYISRTPESVAKLVVLLPDDAPSGSEFQIDSSDTGWTSGRIPLENGKTTDLRITQKGENFFKVTVFDSLGMPISLDQDRIIITKTAATVDAIPASHSVGVEVLERLGGGYQVLENLIRRGDSLPMKGKRVFKAGQSLKAGEANSLNFKLWEGEIEHPIWDNRAIGVMKISGADLDEGVIPIGGDLEVEYEFHDSGNIQFSVSVPSVGATFHPNKKFYSRQEGQVDYSTESALVTQEAKKTLQQIEEIERVIDDPELKQAQQKLNAAISTDPKEVETEKTQENMEGVYESRQVLSKVRKKHLRAIRQLELNEAVNLFNQDIIHDNARESEVSDFTNLVKTAQRSIDKNEKDFEHHLDELKHRISGILWRQDEFVLLRFKDLVENPHLFTDKHRFKELVEIGMQSVKSENIEELREVVVQLMELSIGEDSDNEMINTVSNIIRG